MRIRPAHLLYYTYHPLRTAYSFPVLQMMRKDHIFGVVISTDLYERYRPVLITTLLFRPLQVSGSLSPRDNSPGPPHPHFWGLTR